MLMCVDVSLCVFVYVCVYSEGAGKTEETGERAGAPAPGQGALPKDTLATARPGAMETPYGAVPCQRTGE